MAKIKMTEKAYCAVSNIRRLDMALDALRGMISVGVINKDELNKITEQLYTWWEELLCVIETNVEERKVE